MTSAEIGWYAGGSLGGAKTGSIHMIDNAAVPEMKITSDAFVDIIPTDAVRIQYLAHQLVRLLVLYV